MIKQLNINLPTRWSELTPSQLLFVAGQLLRQPQETELLTNCFLKFAGLYPMSMSIADGHYTFMKGWFNEVRIHPEEFADMACSLEWILAGITLFEPPLKIKGCYAVHYKLYEVSLEDYLIADSMYLAYAQTSNEQFLNTLLAVVYPSRHSTEKHAKHFRKVPLALKYVVFLWFTGLKSWIITQYPYLFSGSGGEFVSPAESAKSIIAALNGGDITKNAVIKQSYVHEALDELNCQSQHAQKL